MKTCQQHASTYVYSKCPMSAVCQHHRGSYHQRGSGSESSSSEFHLHPFPHSRPRLWPPPADLTDRTQADLPQPMSREDVRVQVDGVETKKRMNLRKTHSVLSPPTPTRGHDTPSGSQGSRYYAGGGWWTYQVSGPGQTQPSVLAWVSQGSWAGPGIPREEGTRRSAAGLSAAPSLPPQ